MPARPRCSASAPSVLIAIALVVPIAFPREGRSGPTAGFLETWPGNSLQGWGGGATYSNPGTGGAGGAGDGFLRVATLSTGNLAATSSGTEYIGNWTAAGITGVRLWLNDVDEAQPLELHLVIGRATNFWLYNPGFIPSSQTWDEFTVDLSSASSFTRITGTGTFEEALQNVDRLQIRHDHEPFVQSPDPIQGDFGVDHLRLTGPLVPVRSTPWGRIKALYR